MTQREQEVFDGVVDILKHELVPKKIILFGSRAKGKNQSYSDFDFAVDMPLPDIDKRNALERKIESVAGLYTVDVVFLDAVKPKFKDIVLHTGKVVYES